MTLAVSLVCTMAFSQTGEIAQRLKYITTAPDGTIAMTISDNTGEDTMKLEAANNFYKMEILDNTTSEPIYASHNRGKVCTIDKTKLLPGTYNLRLYTSKFVITSKITIIASRKFNKAFGQDDSIASSH